MIRRGVGGVPASTPALVLAIAACGVIGACAKMEPGLGFDDVQRDVSQRAP